jgi:hypothetical protein
MVPCFDPYKTRYTSLFETSHEPLIYPETWSKGRGKCGVIKTTRYSLNISEICRRPNHHSALPSQRIYLTLEIQEMRLIFAFLSFTSLIIALPKRDTLCQRLSSAKYCEGGNEESVICCPDGLFFLCEADGTLDAGTCDEGTTCIGSLNEQFATNGEAACQ